MIMDGRVRQPEQPPVVHCRVSSQKNREVLLAGSYFCIINGSSLGSPHCRWKYCSGYCHDLEGGIVPALRLDRCPVQGFAIRPAWGRNLTIDPVGYRDAGKIPDLT